MYKTWNGCTTNYSPIWIVLIVICTAPSTWNCEDTTDEVPLNATLSPLRYNITFFEHTKQFLTKSGTVDWHWVKKTRFQHKKTKNTLTIYQVLQKLCPHVARMHLCMTWPETFFPLSRFREITHLSIYRCLLHSTINWDGKFCQVCYVIDFFLQNCLCWLVMSAWSPPPKMPG